MLTVYFDMDGCLSNFDDAYKHWLDGRKPTYETFRSATEDHRLFSKLTLMPNADRLFELMAKFEWDLGINVEILTSINKVNPNQKQIAIDDKRRWLRNHWDFENSSFNAVDRKEEKSRYATPNSILIDDNMLNCRDFDSNYGQSILHVDALVDVTIDGIYRILQSKGMDY